MKLLMGVAVSALVLGMAGSQVEARPKRAKVATVHAADRGTMIHVSFSNHDVGVIREYYAPRYRSLPKGLQKKLHRTGQLPPGWQKKYEPFPVVIERRLVVLPAGYHRGVIDGHAVIFNPRSGVMVDVAVLF